MILPRKTLERGRPVCPRERRDVGGVSFCCSDANDLWRATFSAEGVEAFRSKAGRDVQGGEEETLLQQEMRSHGAGQHQWAFLSLEGWSGDMIP